MLMREIVKIVNTGKDAVYESYKQQLKISDELSKKAETENTTEARRASSDASMKCAQTLAVMMLIDSVDEVWGDVPITRDKYKNDLLYMPIGEDSPDRSVIVCPADEEKEEDDYYYLTGHSQNGEKAIFATFAISKDSAMKMAKNFVVSGDIPGGGGRYR